MTKYKNLAYILLIDDDKFTNVFHTKMIERTNINVSIKAVNNVKDGLAFVSHMNQTNEDRQTLKQTLIFLDINMPALNGWDFLDLYREINNIQKENIIIVMLTTSCNVDDYNRARANDLVADFLNKPLRPETMMRLMDRYFEVDESNHH